MQFGGQSVWHSGNDGAGSGLDADLLDGYQASSFALQSADNILTAHGNEFNFVPGGFSGSIYINYRTKDGANADISEYIFSRGQRNTSVHANVRAANFLATGKLQGDYFDGGYISNYNTNKTYWVGDATRGISSAKAGLTALLSGLHARLWRSGVQVLTVKPGLVDTPMIAGRTLPRWLIATPERVTGDIMNAVDHGRAVLYTPRWWRVIMWVVRLLPECWFRRISV